MNEQHESESVPPPIGPPGPAISEIPDLPPPKPISYWVKRFFACNPFYLVSAALLLFGLYRISVDPAFAGSEVSQLLFNFTSLQIYELLLVLTALFLARRCIWYDSSLLVCLENMLLFVPFMLVSQAGLIERGIVSRVCLASAFLVIVRFAGLKRFYRHLDLPRPLLVVGSILLAINVTMPIVYRFLHETKWGTRPDWGAAYHTNESAWLFVLPAALALANFLPCAREGGSRSPQRRWLPMGLFSLWMLGTGVHLYALGYIYDFALRRELVAPALWVLAWTAYRLLPRLFPALAGTWKRAVLVAPVFITLITPSEVGTKVFFPLTALNVILYGAMCLLERNNRPARHLLFASAVLLLAGLPLDWIHYVTPNLGRGTYVVAAIGAYLLFYVSVSRDPRLALLGSVVVATSVIVFFGEHGVYWAAQGALVFLLVHSVRWNDSQYQGAGVLRLIAEIFWVLHTLMWIRLGAPFWLPCLPAAVVLMGYFATQLFRGRRRQSLLPAAMLVMLSGPGNALIGLMQTMPLGIIAVVGSFLLFAVGTVAALTRHRWQQGRN